VYAGHVEVDEDGRINQSIKYSFNKSFDNPLSRYRIR